MNMRSENEAVKLAANAFGGNAAEEVLVRAHRVSRGGFDFESELRAKPATAQYAQGILGKAGGRVPHASKNAVSKVFEAAERI